MRLGDIRCQVINVMLICWSVVYKENHSDTNCQSSSSCARYDCDTLVLERSWRCA